MELKRLIELILDARNQPVADLADFFGVSDRTIRLWKSTGNINQSHLDTLLNSASLPTWIAKEKYLAQLIEEDIQDYLYEKITLDLFFDTFEFHCATQNNDIESYQNYLVHYPTGTYKKMVFNAIEYQTFEQVEAKNTIDAYQQFLEDYPNGKYTAKVKNAIEDLSFEQAQVGNILTSYQQYLVEYPSGKYVIKAKAAIRRKQWRIIFASLASLSIIVLMIGLSLTSKPHIVVLDQFDDDNQKDNLGTQSKTWFPYTDGKGSTVDFSFQNYIELKGTLDVKKLSSGAFLGILNELNGLEEYKAISFSYRSNYQFQFILKGKKDYKWRLQSSETWREVNIVFAQKIKSWEGLSNVRQILWQSSEFNDDENKEVHFFLDNIYLHLK